MKKVMLLAGVICFVLVCCSRGQCAKEEATDTTLRVKHIVNTRKNKTSYRRLGRLGKYWRRKKEVLLQDRKAKYDQCKVEREKKSRNGSNWCKMSDWDNLTIDDKSLFDEFDQFAKTGKHHGDKEGCCSKIKNNSWAYKASDFEIFRFSNKKWAKPLFYKATGKFTLLDNNVDREESVDRKEESELGASLPVLRIRPPLSYIENSHLES